MKNASLGLLTIHEELWLRDSSLPLSVLQKQQFACKCQTINYLCTYICIPSSCTQKKRKEKRKKII